MHTPYYLLDETRLRRNLALIRRTAERSGAEIILAFKAYALWRTFPIFREYISHTTASSADEARLAREEFGSLAHTYSPAYTEADFGEVMRSSSHITFNSLTQLQRFAPAIEAWNADASHHNIKTGLRINPEYSEITTELYNPCAPGSRFGVLADALPTQLPCRVSGLHVHCLCENGADTLARTLHRVEERFAPWLSQVSWLNLGGGHLITREGYDTDLLVSTLRAFQKRHPAIHLILEPGSAFAWQTGELVASVVDIVSNHGIQTAILDVSFTCHMPDCLEMPYHPAVRGALLRDDHHPSATHTCAYRLGGNSCLSGDYMGTWLFREPLNVGDTIVFEDMLHYTTVKTTTFNGVHHPSIALRHTDGTIQELRRYTYADYRDRMD